MHEGESNTEKTSIRHIFSSTPASGKIIADEEDENVPVTYTTYKMLFKPGGGCCTVTVI